ncbi:MAG: hypothetical protein NTY19_08535 [Planctomycetota bacterium]|nr:hypothetical protein [Planctomycetota bacterium]
MRALSVRISDLSGLREFVQQKLCERNELEVGAFQFTERHLEKRGVPCGICFCLHGPRSVKLMAIWETSRNTIMFYDSNGQRVQRAQLAPGPRCLTAAA